jgi:hypothetical protein
MMKQGVTMGVDISAYRNVKRVMCDRGSEGECDHEYAHPNEDFPGRADDISRGCYEVADDDKSEYEQGVHRAYSSYNRWRERLCAVVLGVQPDQVWNYPEHFAGKPFFELINFSDCEGVIGPQTCAKLAKDFEELAWADQVER